MRAIVYTLHTPVCNAHIADTVHVNSSTIAHTVHMCWNGSQCPHVVTSAYSVHHVDNCGCGCNDWGYDGCLDSLIVDIWCAVCDVAHCECLWYNRGRGHVEMMVSCDCALVW